MMTIRDAVIADIPEIMPILRMAHRLSEFSKTDFDEVHVHRILTVGVTMPNFFCQVVEDAGKIIGVLGGFVDVNIWGVKVGTELIAHSKRDTHILERNFEKWAKTKGAQCLVINEITGNKRYNKFVERMGYRQTGANFTKDI